MAESNGDACPPEPPPADAAEGEAVALFLHRPPYGDHREARGWAFDAIGRSVSFVGNAVFVGTAVIHLARIHAGCEPTDDQCDGRAYGIRPSSFLSLYNVIVGLASSALLPLLGAIVDHTPHRLLVGKISAVVYCMTLFPMIFLSEKTWFAVAILLIFSAFVGWIHSGMAFAYLPEMSDEKAVLERLNTSFTVVQFGTDVIYIIVVVGLAAAAGWVDDSLATARLAQSISFAATTVVWIYSWWRLLKPRQAMSALPEGSWLLTVGFKKIYRTSIHIIQHHRPLAWLYAAIAFAESATQALLIIATTYSIELLDFSSVETGITLLILLVSSSVGCYISPFSHRRMSPIRSYQLCLFLIGAFTAAASAVVSGEEQKGLFYMLAVFWGACGGWKYTVERFLTITLIPEGQDAELMGVYLFAGQILAWVPPLVFTAMNEAGISIRINMLCLLLFWFIGIVCLQCMGSYDDAVNASLESHHHAVAEERGVVSTEPLPAGAKN